MTEENIFLNLRSVPCPLNVVKCKLALEKLKPLCSLIVELDLGEPEEMVKHSLEQVGYQCITIKKYKDYIRYSISHGLS